MSARVQSLSTLTTFFRRERSRVSASFKYLCLISILSILDCLLGRSNIYQLLWVLVVRVGLFPLSSFSTTKHARFS